MSTGRVMAGRGYSASIFCSQIGAESGQALVETALKLPNGLAENEKPIH